VVKLAPRPPYPRERSLFYPLNRKLGETRRRSGSGNLTTDHPTRKDTLATESFRRIYLGMWSKMASYHHQVIRAESYRGLT